MCLGRHPRAWYHFSSFFLFISSSTSRVFSSVESGETIKKRLSLRARRVYYVYLVDWLMELAHSTHKHINWNCVRSSTLLRFVNNIVITESRWKISCCSTGSIIAALLTFLLCSFLLSVFRNRGNSLCFSQSAHWFWETGQPRINYEIQIGVVGHNYTRRFSFW